MGVAQSVGQDVYRLGQQGPVVKEIQVALARFGYPLKGTGYFGPATDAAVTDFQKRHGMNGDGRVGPRTAAALDTGVDAVRDIPPVVKTEIARPLWLTAGLKYINVHEGSGSADNPQILDWAKEEGGDIAKTYKEDSIPWCALFANHILTMVGLKGTETLWALDFAGKWPSTKLAGPAVGAFAPMQRPGGGHIICIVGKDQHGNVMGLGGNQSDQVSVVPFPLARLNKGFWWPRDIPLPQDVGMSTLPIVRSNGQISSKEA